MKEVGRKEKQRRQWDNATDRYGKGADWIRSVKDGSGELVEGCQDKTSGVGSRSVYLQTLAKLKVCIRRQVSGGSVIE